jgi:hypothetical protein
MVQKREGVLIQIRVPEAEADALKQAAHEAGRNLPQEMRHRLNAYEGGAGDSLSRVIGALAAQITSDVEVNFAAGPTSPEMLGTIRDTLVRVLDGMGAVDPGDLDQEFSLAKFVSFKVLRWLRSPVPLPDEPPAMKRVRAVLTSNKGN